METTDAQAEIASPNGLTRPDMQSSIYDPDPENWLSRAIGIFLGLAISAAAVGGIIGLLHLGGRL